MVVMYRFKIFFKNALGFTNRLNGQFLIAHCWNSTQLNPLFKYLDRNLFRFRNLRGCELRPGKIAACWGGIPGSFFR